jgi:hypothetical protein
MSGLSMKSSAGSSVVSGKDDGKDKEKKKKSFFGLKKKS